MYNLREFQKHRYDGEEDHGEERVAQNAGRDVNVDSRLAHQIQNGIHAHAAQHRHAVNVSKVQFARLLLITKFMISYHEEKGAEKDAEKERACQIRVVHNVLVEAFGHIQHRQRLPTLALVGIYARIPCRKCAKS